MPYQNFPYTNFHEANQDYILKKFKQVLDEWDITSHTWEETKEYIMNFFKNLDLTEEVNNKIQEMLDDGTIAEMLGDEVVEMLLGRLEKVLNVYDRNYIFIGDSYAGFGWVESMVSALRATKYVKKYADGSGFSIDGNDWTTLLNSIPDDGTVNYIICGGGYNEQWSSLDEIQAGVASFVNVAKRKFPNAIIFYGFMAWSGTATNYRTLRATIGRMEQACGVYGIQFVKDLYLVLHDLTHLQADNIHPVPQWSQVQGQIFASSVMGGSSSFSYSIEAIEPTWINGWSVNGDTNIYVCADASGAYFTNTFFLSLANTGGIAVLLDGTNPITLANMPRGIINGTAVTVTAVPCVIQVQKESKYYEAFACIRIFAGQLQFIGCKLKPESEGTGYLNETITAIQLPPFQLIVPPDVL